MLEHSFRIYRKQCLALRRTLDEHSTRHLDDKKKESGS
ncbi:hypothetical protein T08_10679 [Trichinella sp. T8]|nr:hypothetical protein T08_10679 [Trichinella sp. T8]